MKKTKKRIASRRYYYHRVLKDRYVIDAAKREIKVPYQAFTDIPTPDRFYIGQLIKLGYNVQLKLL